MNIEKKEWKGSRYKQTQWNGREIERIVNEVAGFHVIKETGRYRAWQDETQRKAVASSFFLKSYGVPLL